MKFLFWLNVKINVQLTEKPLVYLHLKSLFELNLESPFSQSFPRLERPEPFSPTYQCTIQIVWWISSKCGMLLSNVRITSFLSTFEIPSWTTDSFRIMGIYRGTACRSMHMYNPPGQLSDRCSLCTGTHAECQPTYPHRRNLRSEIPPNGWRLLCSAAVLVTQTLYREKIKSKWKSYL